MKYNIYFELAAAALLVVLNLYVYLQYPSDSPSNRHFKRLAGVLFLAVNLDVSDRDNHKLCRTAFRYGSTPRSILFT